MRRHPLLPQGRQVAHGTLDHGPSPARMSELACTHGIPHEIRRSLRLGRRQRLFRRTPRRRWRCGLGDLRQAGHCPVRPGVPLAEPALELVADGSPLAPAAAPRHGQAHRIDQAIGRVILQAVIPQA